jgi:5-methylcytosine-specific restriction endonuclease McrA
MLQDSFKKQSVCPYSGRKLEVGRNLSLDHRIAKSNGGTNDLDNLQWVDRYVNLAKHDMSENDFLALVKDIYDYRIAAKRKP